MLRDYADGLSQPALTAADPGEIRYDEVIGPDGSLRPSWKPLAEVATRLRPDDLRRVAGEMLHAGEPVDAEQILHAVRAKDGEPGTRPATEVDDGFARSQACTGRWIAARQPHVRLSRDRRLRLRRARCTARPPGRSDAMMCCKNSSETSDVGTGNTPS